MARVLVQPDLQIPFHHPDAIPFLLSVNDKYKCNEFVNIGDEIDMSTLSVSHIPDPDGMGFKEEFRQSLEVMKELYKIWPKMKVCISNHTIRPIKKALYAGVPSVFLKTYQEFLGAPDTWVWRDEWIIDNVRYVHGEGLAGQMGHIRGAAGHRTSQVNGHLHSFAGINYLNNFKGDLIFGMNVGCLIDEKLYAFKYSKHFLHKATLGCGVVIDGVPFFIPMLVDKKNRWIGKIP